MTNSTDTFWEVDGHSLQTYAYNIVTWGEDREAPPPLRGSDTAVAYRPGQIWHAKTPDSRTLTMGFWVQGSNEDGSVPSDGVQNAKFQQNFKMLRKLLFRPRQQFQLKKKFYLYGDPTLYTATALVEYAGGLNVVMNGTDSGVFTIDLNMADPYFYGDPVNLVLDPHNPEQEFEILGDDRALKIVTTINGATSRLRVANSTYDIFFDYTKPLPAGQTATVDNLNFLATHNVGGTNESASTWIDSSATDPFWFFLEPGPNTLSIQELDVPAQGVEWTNLATNPSFETPGTTTSVLQNFIANTNFAAADNVNAQSVWKKNLFVNPNFTSSTTGASALVAASLTQSTVQGKLGTTSVAVTTNGASGSGVAFPITYDIAVASNPFLYCGAWVLAPSGFGFTVSVSNVGSSTPQSYVGTGSWQWVQTGQTSTPAKYTGQPVFSIVQTSAGSSKIFYVDGVTVQREPIDEAFYGDLTDNHDGNGFSYSWVGTADNSQSLKQAGLAELYRNLAPNPMFANDVSPASAAQNVIYTNSMTNPNMEASSAFQHARTNSIINPKAATATTGWSGVNGATNMTLSSVASGGPSTVEPFNNAPASYLNATLASYAANTSVVISPTASGGVYAASPTQRAVFSAWIYTTSTLLNTSALPVKLYIDWYDSSSALISSSTSTCALTANTWARVNVSAFPPATASTAKLRIEFGYAGNISFAANTSFRVTGALFEFLSYVGQYFDGSTGSSGNFTRTWGGTANNSSSFENVASPLLRRNRVLNPLFASAGSAVVGGSGTITYSTSLQAGGPSATGASVALTAAGAALISQKTFNLNVGEPYTFSAYLYSPKAATWTLGASWYSSSDFGSVTVAADSTTTASLAANTWTRVNFTVTVPANATSAVFYLKNTTLASGDVFQTTGWQLEFGSNLTALIYGGALAVGEFSFSWWNTTSLSETYETPSSTTVPTFMINPSYFGEAYRSVVQKTSGSASLAVKAYGVRDDTSAAALYGQYMTAGSYTVIAKCIIPAVGGPQGTPGTNALRLAPSSSTSYTVQQSVPNSPGTYTFKASFTVSSTTPLLLWNGYPQGVVYWDDVAIIAIPDLDHPYPFDQPFHGTDRTALPTAMSGISSYADFYDGFAWTGTADASSTSFYALQPVGTNPATNCLAVTSRFSVTSHYGVSLDATGLRIIPTSLSSNNSYVSPGGDAGGLRLGMAAGKTYYISGYVTGTLTGSQNANAKRMVLLYKDSGGVVQTVTDHADTDSSHRYIIASIPAGATEAYVRLYNGALSGNGDAIWTQFGVRQIDPTQASMTSFPALASGDDVSGLDPRIVLRWTGTRWASPTAVMAPRPFKAGASSQYTSLAPDPFLVFPSDGSTPEMTIDSTVPYIGRCVAVQPEAGLLNNVTYTLRGSITISAASASPGATDNRASVIWSLGGVTVVSESTIPNTPGTHDYSLVFTTPASGSLSEIDLFFSQGSDGKTSSWGNLMLIVGNAPSYSYFDGDSSPDADLTASWTGVENQSSAKLSGTVPKNISSSNCAAVQSTQWAANGTISVRLIPASTTSTTTMVIASTASGSAMAQIAEGVTYTLLATRRLSAPLSGALSNFAGRAALSTTNLGTIYSDQVLPNTAGATELRWNFTVPVGAGFSNLRLGHGGSINSGDVFWDQVLILQQDSDSPYAGGYFDGSTPDTDLANYEWSGTANDSTSIIRGVGSLEPIVITYQPAYI